MRDSEIYDTARQIENQTIRVQHNHRATLFLTEMAIALAGTPEQVRHYTEGMTFTIQMGAGTDNGKAAASLLRTVVRDMLPEIVARTIAYAQAGNHDALVEIGQLAETLKDS